MGIIDFDRLSKCSNKGGGTLLALEDSGGRDR